MTVRARDALLVTGGAGFIGSAFVRSAMARPGFVGRIVNLDALTYAGNLDNLAGVDPARHVFVKGDIRDASLVARLLDEHPVTAVVHFAAESHVDRSIHGPAAFIDTNIGGTLSLLEAVRARPNIHFHHVSTDEVYGSLGDTGVFTETSPYLPNSPYAASKAASDHLVRAWGRTYGLSTTVSHASNNYGPYQFPEKLIPLMIANCLAGKPLPIYGTGGNVRDWLHVDDHVEALWTILERGVAGEVYDVGGGNEWKNLDLVLQLVALVAELRGEPVERYRALVTFVTDRQGHDLRYAIAGDKLARELGWRPTFDFVAGLRATIQWYLDQPEWIARVQTGAYREWIATNYQR